MDGEYGSTTGYEHAQTPFPQHEFEDTSAKYPGLQKLYRSYFEIHGYVAATVCVWGICANIANIVVLTRKNMTSSTNTILTWLAVADLMTMLSYLPISIHFYILYDPELGFPSSRDYGWIIFMLFHISFAVLAHTVAIWLTITLAIFRYLYICHPTHGKELCTVKRAKIAVLLTYLTIAIVCIPHYMSTKIAVRDMPEMHVNDTARQAINATVSHPDDVYYVITEADNTALLNFNYWIQSILIKLIPCILLTILTIMLIVAMHKANRRRQKLMSQGRKGESEREHETNRTTGMLLAVVTLFLITELPQGILTLCSIFIPWFFSQVYISLGDLLDIAALLNNSINFVLYCTMSRQFRNTFVRTFCDCNSGIGPEWMKLRVFHSRNETAQNTANGTSDSKIKSCTTDNTRCDVKDTTCYDGKKATGDGSNSTDIICDAKSHQGGSCGVIV